MKKLAVVALGGNAILRENQIGSIEQQEANTIQTIENLIYLVRDGYNLVITHGNGPQVGNILLRNDAGEQLYDVVPMPLDICVADSQGGMGYMIERMLRNVLRREGIEKNVLSFITMVSVDPDDEAFKNPRKRIGKYYSKLEAEVLAENKGWVFKESTKISNKYRRVVPSPKPVNVLNHETIEVLANQGHIIIAAGGGGIPVYIDEKNDIRTLDAVIDKDMASSLLASEIGADELYILTDVPYIYKNYGKKDQEKLEFLDYNDATKYLNEGVFGEGSMAPKIRASLQFIKEGGEKAVITESTKLEDRTFGSKITMNYD